MLQKIKGLINKISGTKTKTEQSGRSMVEMLGVLAIIGVLSLGALEGYSYAMDRHRANATMNDINLRAVDLTIQITRNLDLNLDEWGTLSTAGYVFSDPEWTTDGFVKLPVNGLSERVCKMVVEGLQSQYDMDVNGDIYEGDLALCGENATVTVYIDGGIDEAGGGSETDEACKDVVCGMCEKCQGGTCVAACSAQRCVNGHCEICPDDQPILGSDGACHSCDEPGELPLIDEADCGLCPNRVNENGCRLPCPADKPIRGSDGSCYPCEEDAAITVFWKPAECSKCSNRILMTQPGVPVAGYCVWETCPSSKPLRANYTSHCYSCEELGVIGAVNCSVCPNRTEKAGLEGPVCVLTQCTGDNPLRSAHDSCHSCYANERIDVSGVTTNCSVCPNRKLDGNYCVLSNCPDDKPLRDSYDVCHSCDEQSRINVEGRTGNCSVCADRYLRGTDCNFKCPDEKPLQDRNGLCHSCDEVNSIWLSGITANCSVCPDRKLNGDDCVLSRCPDDKPLQDQSGTCHSCLTNNHVDVTDVAANCSACSNRVLAGSLSYGGQYCVLQCVPDKPLLDVYGICHACDDDEWIRLSDASDCTRCPDRMLNEYGSCILK